jgi:hypothetical protein
LVKFEAKLPGQLEPLNAELNPVNVQLVTPLPPSVTLKDTVTDEDDSTAGIDAVPEPLGDEMLTLGGLRSILFPEIGPAVAQLPARSQT